MWVSLDLARIPEARGIPVLTDKPVAVVGFCRSASGVLDGSNTLSVVTGLPSSFANWPLHHVPVKPMRPPKP